MKNDISPPPRFLPSLRPYILLPLYFLFLLPKLNKPFCNINFELKKQPQYSGQVQQSNSNQQEHKIMNNIGVYIFSNHPPPRDRGGEIIFKDLGGNWKCRDKFFHSFSYFFRPIFKEELCRLKVETLIKS